MSFLADKKREHESIAEAAMGERNFAKAFFHTAKAADFAGAEERRVAPPWMGGNSVRGETYIHRISVPNFYFHVTTAYAILRHNGVPLGKMDFVGVKDFAALGE